MDSKDKIKKLTDKIYLEGIEKAQKEAELILINAKEDAESIINTAKVKEKQIIEEAKKHATELRVNIDSEIRLAARQFMSNLKQQISEIITYEQVETPIREAFNDKGFLQNIMLTIINNWKAHNQDRINLDLLLPEKDEEKLNAFFNGKTKEFLSSGLEINFTPAIKSGFKISPKNSNYHISFTDDDFVNYFKNYLKDKTRKMIFD